mgnify:CR=1 FL=1
MVEVGAIPRKRYQGKETARFAPDDGGKIRTTTGCSFTNIDQPRGERLPRQAQDATPAGTVGI